MKRLVIHFMYLMALVMTGCGGSPEEKPPEKAPEMTAEEKKNMEDQMEMMRRNYKKQ